MPDCDYFVLDASDNKVCMTRAVTAGLGFLDSGDAGALWLIVCGALVFYMHLGFSMLEAGCVSKRNVQNILLKNVMNAFIGTVVWFCFGFGFSFGNKEDNPFIGTDSFFKISESDYTTFFFQWAFCVTASTIVSGAVAERMKLEAFFIACICITGFVYPVVVHWVWDDNGWLSAGNDKAIKPIIDFAGSGVVHMVGGWSAFMGAWLTGPRPGRFDEKSEVTYGNHSVPFQLFGTMTLWFGWYGFNCGSTLGVAGVMGVAARAAVMTTLAAAAGGMATGLVHLGITKKWNIGMCCNGILAGLVSITANCSVVAPGSALLIGALGGIFYYGFSNLLVKIKVDDPLDASAVHGCCGLWGLIAAGLFADSAAVSAAYADTAYAASRLPLGTRFANQLIGAIAIFAWTVAMTGAMFKIMDLTMGLRTEEGSKSGGLDAGEFGIPAYSVDKQTPAADSSQMEMGRVKEETGKNRNTSMELSMSNGSEQGMEKML